MSVLMMVAGDFLTNTYARKAETIPTSGSVRVPYSTDADADEETNGTISVSVLADDSDIIKYLIAPNNAGSATLSVIDNDDSTLPSITISTNQTSINEGDLAIFTVTSADTFTAPLSVLIEITETNSGTGDFLGGPSNKFTLPNRTNLQEITRSVNIPLRTTQDATTETNGTITVRVKTDDLPTKTYSVGAAHSASVTVVDDDIAGLPRLAIALKDPSKSDITEGDPNPVFTITSTGGTNGETMNVDVRFTETENFLQTPNEVKSPLYTVGTPLDVVVALDDDDVDEMSGRIFATLQNNDQQKYSIGLNHQAIVSISDNDDTPEISISVADKIVEGTDSDQANFKTYTFNVTLNRQSMRDITVEFDFGADSDTAELGESKDYTHNYDTLAKRTLTFAGATPGTAGETMKTIAVTIIADALDELDETFTVTLSNPMNAGFAESAQEITATGKIEDDDDVPNISFNSLTAENTEGSDINFDVSLSTISSQDITFSYTLTDGTATTADNDYINPIKSSRTVMIPAGEQTKRISVSTTQDDDDEADETFKITLVVPPSQAGQETLVALGSQPTATGTILSDDNLVFTISGMNIAEGDDPDSEDVKLEFDISISSGATESETISYATSDGPAQSGGAIAKAGSDYMETTGSHTFVDGEPKTHTVSVPIMEDSLYELDESFTMTLSGNDSSDTEILISSAVGTIENDDPFLPSTIAVIAKNNGYVTEGSAIGYEFTADPELAEDLVLNISHTQVGDFLMDIPGSTITIPANTSLTTKHMESFATKSANGKVEADGSVTLTIEADTYFPSDPNDRLNYSVDGTNGRAVVRIEDADTPSGVSIIALSSESTEGDTVQFEIKADATSTEARSVNINVDDGTAEFIANTGDRSITIPANNRSFILDVPIIEDSAPEQHGIITVTIEDPSALASFAYSVAITYNSAAVSVYDDDAPTGISVAAIPMSVTEAPNTYAEFQIISDTIDNSIDRIIEVRVENASGSDFIDVANQDATYNYNSSDEIFDVTIPAGARFGLLRVKIHDDSKHEDNGQITATVVTTPAPSHNSATIMIEDNDPDVPIISISSAAEAIGVTEGFQFTFEVESDRTFSGNPLEIVFDVMDGGTGATITGTSVMITGALQSAVGTVTLPNADVSSTGTNIIIKVLEADEYDVSASDPSITVPVRDNDAPSTTLPRMSISSANYVADGEKIEFTVTASHIPATSTVVKIMLSGDINFLHDEQARALDVSLNGVQKKTFDVDTKPNSASSNHGIITATILESADYVRPNTTAENESSFAVVDNLPVISIAEIADVNKSAGTFSVTLTSDSPALAGHPINITTLSVADSNTSGPQYYGSHSPNPVIIMDSSTGNAEQVTVTLTKDDSIYQGWGEISVSLTNGADYTADTSANSRSVTIIDDQTAPVSVAVSARGSAVEGTTFDVTFTATGTFPANGTIKIVPTISETGTTATGYLGSHTPQMVTLSTANTSDKIAINSLDNSNSESNGEITISIMRGDGFEVHATDHTKVVMVLDDESLPKVSVSAISSNIDEGLDAIFELVATGTLANPLDVFVSVDDGASDFLANTYTRKTETIPTTSSVRVPYSTVADSNDESNGTITVEVLDDNRDIIQYLVDTAIDKSSTASVSIIDNDDSALPSITITGDQSSITEGDVATFTLTATDPVSASLSVLVEVIETNSGTGDFFGGPSNHYTPNRINIDETTKTGKIELPTIRDDVDEDDGSISIRIKSDDLATKTYAVGAAHRASISVTDDDDTTLPNLTIALKDLSKTSITEGDPNPVFTITSTGGTTGDIIEVDVKITETANFLQTANEIKSPQFTIGTPLDLTVEIDNDDVDEPNGTIYATLQLKNPRTYGIGTVHQASIDISDDELPPEITISAAIPSHYGGNRYR